MFFGFWNKTRAHKENIIYAIVTIFLLERVRTRWNGIEREGKGDGVSRSDIGRRQDRLVVEASFLYALPLLLPVLKYIYRSIEELSWSVPGLVALKNMWVFAGILLVTECFLALVIYNLLRIYVERMNAATGFFTKIGRDIWDGSKTAVQVSSNVGSRVLGGVQKLTTASWNVVKSAVRKSRHLSLPDNAQLAGARDLPVVDRRAHHYSEDIG